MPPQACHHFTYCMVGILNYQVSWIFKCQSQKYPVMETEYGQQLAKELKQARIVAKQNIGKKQKEQIPIMTRKAKK